MNEHMTIYNKIRMKVFGCKWEYLGKQRLMFGNENVPNWVHKKTIRLRPGTVGEFRGKTFLYRAVRLNNATNYGQTPALFYRRLRKSAWEKSQK